MEFHSLTVDAALDLLESYLDEDKNHIIVTPNPEGVMQARRNPAFMKALVDADLRLADGTGIVLASRYIRDPLPERVRGVDTIFALLERLNAKGRNHTAYFLGGEPGISEQAAANMENRFPTLSVLGHHHGFFTPDQVPQIIEEINYLKPDILLVCTGMPRAEIWATTHRAVQAKLTLCLGGTMDIMAGKANLAPSFFRKIGLEWLYRLLRQPGGKSGKQPSRWKRVLDIPRFVWAVIRGGKNQ